MAKAKGQCGVVWNDPTGGCSQFLQQERYRQYLGFSLEQVPSIGGHHPGESLARTLLQGHKDPE